MATTKPPKLTKSDTEVAFTKEVTAWLRKHNCIVLKMTPGPGVPTGFPDWLCLAKDGGFYFCLELKKSKNAKHQPGQDQWIKRLDEMSYAKFVWPGEQWEKVKDELSQML